MAFLIYSKGPIFYSHYKMQGQLAPEFNVETLSGERINLAQYNKKLALVFWATWCGPCRIELTRLNQLIKDKVISADSVLALSIGEEPQVVKDDVIKNNYLFKVGLDQDMQIANLYKVNSTPTIAFIDDKHYLNWMSSGLSPIIAYRMKWFFN